MDTKLVKHGYYRYTDITFEWHITFENLSDRSALKAFISPDSLTSPENPLNLHSKEKRFTLFMGTLENGESRLLFSSKQVEYIRYWLHTVGFTESLLPVPAGSYLLTSRDLKTTSPITFKTGAELKQAIKDISKNNKRLKGTDKALLAFRDTFELVRTCWSERKGAWLALDFESWEMEHTMITEFGYSLLAWDDGNEKTEDGHFMIQEYLNYYNTTFVVNNRDHYLFGKSQIMRLSAVKQFIYDMITKYTAAGPLYLVFHDHVQDIRYLKQLEAPVQEISYRLPESCPPSKGIYVIDTSYLFAALEGRSEEMRSLSRMCALLQIPDLDRFHNAGNDAHFTLLALNSMASGDPLDKQRSKRWPGQEELTARGGRKAVIDWAPHQVESDYDDMEGIFPPPKPGQSGYKSDDSTVKAGAS